MLGKLANKGAPGVQYTKLDVRKHGLIAQQHGVSSIPDTRVFHNGAEVAAFTGLRGAAAIEKLLAPHRANLIADKSSASTDAPVEVPQAIQPGDPKTLPPGIQPIPAS